MILLDHLIAQLQAHGTVTVDWRTFADTHFPGHNAVAQAREWAAKQGLVLIFVQPGARDLAGQPEKATFFRAIPRYSSEQE